MTKKCCEQRSRRQRRGKSSFGIIWPREFECNISSLPPSAHTHTFVVRWEQRRTQSLWAAGNIVNWHFKELQRPLSVKGAKHNHVKKNTFPYGKDLYEISGGIEPISDLLRASDKWVPSLRNPMAGDLWESPQVSYGSCFCFGDFYELPFIQRLVGVWQLG